MSPPYGKPPARRSRPTQAVQPGEIQNNITGRHTMEQLALEVQRALAMVQDYGAFGIEKFRFRLLPLDAQARPTVLPDEHGHQVMAINIPDVPAEPVYRQDEPGGVGVMSASEASPSTAPTAPEAQRRSHR